MTREELKEEITPIVCDLTRSKVARGQLLALALQGWFTLSELDTEEAGNVWNDVMVEIVDENKLGLPTQH